MTPKQKLIEAIKHWQLGSEGSTASTVDEFDRGYYSACEDILIFIEGILP